MILFSHAFAGMNPLLNDREAEKSSLIKKLELKKLNKMSLDAAELNTFVMKTISEFKLADACSTDLVASLDKARSEHEEYSLIPLEKFLKIIRIHKIIDDVLLNILLKSAKFNDQLQSMEAVIDDEEVDAPVETPDVVTTPTTPVEKDRDLKSFEDYLKRKKAKKCIIENVKQLAGDFRGKDSKKFNFKKTLNAKLRNQKVKSFVSDEVKRELRIAAKHDVDNWTLTLNDYIQKKQSLRTQYPLTRLDERTNFVSLKSSSKPKISHRRRLYEQYSYFQIILMGNVIKKLKERMDSNHIDILVYRRDEQLLETIPLDPMERYRFSVKILQKEMKELTRNSYFAGKAAAYTDILAAAYEIGIVTAIEIDEVAKLEEIWNPKKTLFEKSWTWIKMFGNVATILIPPPFGFIPSLAIVAIEAATKKPEKEEGHTLF